MRVLHIIPDFHIGEPQLAVLEFARVARMRGVHASVLALSDEGRATRTLLDRQLISAQPLSSDADGALEMQLLQHSVDVVQTHSLADFSTVLPAVSSLNMRLVHVFHSCMARESAELPAGNGYVDSVAWVQGTKQDDNLGRSDLGELPTILDSVWSPPSESLRPAEHRRALGVGADELCVGAGLGDNPDDTIDTLKAVRSALSRAGFDSRMILFGGEDAHELPDGFEVVDAEDADFVDRLSGLDTFVQLRANDFCQLSLLALARRVPVVLPGPEVAERFRGGWSPFRFVRGDADDLASKLHRYARFPDMHDVHRKLVRDYVLTFRDSMSMVGEYGRLYKRRAAECSAL